MSVDEQKTTAIAMKSEFIKRLEEVLQSASDRLFPAEIGEKVCLETGGPHNSPLPSFFPTLKQ